MNKFVGNPEEVKIPQCYRCRHYMSGYVCRAFSAGIPETILNNFHDHRQPYPGDNGIRFEPIEKPKK